ncbi:MAG: Excinuclease ABC subunit C [uncultured Thermomicrobiales bacterium]|uniref:Excinuclease ABC subunit C n=1 Tax=uncultured Thermomicrobiales bacterium TaxID=1645740 RepID=A0A6J4VK61_9BACT|nr:MAG: Excinuclease ABC subunit C [uncultured Thermomicrobiales bacterium]
MEVGTGGDDTGSGHLLGTVPEMDGPRPGAGISAGTRRDNAGPTRVTDAPAVRRTLPARDGATVAPGPAADSGGSGRYAFLSERAAAFVEEKGGAVHEDLLIAHVFGGAGHVTMWRPLLRQVLATDPALTLRPDGCWATTATRLIDDGTPLLREFVAVDVETTGLKPTTQRVIEIAAVRFRDGVETGRFETLLNPGRRIPKFIVELTRITDTDVAEAPPFEEIAELFLEFLGPSLVVGHNVRFDLGFLDQELRRAGRPGLTNERVDTIGLATRFLPEVRKPSLDKVALACGLNPRKIHRAGVDAELTGQVAIRLLARARAEGVADVDLIKAVANSAERRPRDKVGRGRAVLDRSLLADIPRATGVYLMRDAYGHVVYVGKAKNLRDRVGSYYSQPIGYRRKMDGLLENLAAIDTVVVGSELEALLLEAQLIRRYQPRYNTALRSFEHYPFIRVDIANPWPRVTLAKERRGDGAAYFGPFRNKSGARKTVDLINGVIPLRTCSRSFKDARSYGSPCIQLDLGKCAGPCVGRADRETYRAMVHDVVRFLDGRDEVLYERLWGGLEDAAARLDFERAAKLRNDLRTVTQVVAAHRALREAAETQTLLLVLPAPDPAEREVVLVAGGRRWAQVRADRGDPPDLAWRLARAWDRYRASGHPPLDHDTVDEANILNRWLYHNAGHPAILPLGDPAPVGPEEWHGLARRALALDDDALTTAVAAAELDDPLPDDVDLSAGDSGEQQE